MCLQYCARNLIGVTPAPMLRVICYYHPVHGKLPAVVALVLRRMNPNIPSFGIALRSYCRLLHDMYSSSMHLLTFYGTHADYTSNVIASQLYTAAPTSYRFDTQKRISVNVACSRGTGVVPYAVRP